ncbi:unnamed protein product [Nezara viridula]|uniref:Cationic amino acid transporter C-terminal domain-containing protein n=1 Tax=Nezara viridula TaxID=85310 RepID=A0A9P0H796_NEZVI|nr:unnamed protein product [Nezara viridula]
MRFYKPLLRQKTLEQVNGEESELGRVLTTLDLTALGVGCTLGVGVYVLPGIVAKELAGPGVVISFFIAAVASIFAGLCFAEFGARVPKAGSAYIYSYVTVGEFVAFVIGWNLIMEYIIGTASVARGLSVYIDTLIGNPMESFYRNIYELNETDIMSEYFDIFAFVISFLVTLSLAFRQKESVLLNNLLTFLNISVVLFVVILGSMKIDFKNWNLEQEKVPPWAGNGGFLPFGISGAIKGAATCFYGYVGFDVISTSGEEVENPQKSIPISIIASLVIVFLAYFGLSSVLTLIWPYYLQDVDAPIPYVLAEIGFRWAAWIVAVGGIFGLLASLYSGMFPLPRIIYSMANDGLLFKWLGKVNSKYHTPVVGTVVSGIVTGIMASMFKLKQLVDLVSLGTLLAYTLVAVCILVLRYREEIEQPRLVTHDYVEHAHLISKKIRVTCDGIVKQYFNTRKFSTPSGTTSAVVVFNVIVYSLLCVILSLVLVQYEENLINTDPCTLSVCGILVFFMSINLFSTFLQPSDARNLHFKVPLVPILPALSIFINIYLMISLAMITWIQFGIWLLIGLAIYFSYGINHSTQRWATDRVEYEIIRSDDEAHSNGVSY